MCGMMSFILLSSTDAAFPEINARNLIYLILEPQLVVRGVRTFHKSIPCRQAGRRKMPLAGPDCLAPWSLEQPIC